MSAIPVIHPVLSAVVLKEIPNMFFKCDFAFLQYSSGVDVAYQITRNGLWRRCHSKYSLLYPIHQDFVIHSVETAEFFAFTFFEEAVEPGGDVPRDQFIQLLGVDSPLVFTEFFQRIDNESGKIDDTMLCGSPPCTVCVLVKLHEFTVVFFQFVQAGYQALSFFLCESLQKGDDGITLLLFYYFVEAFF